MPIEGSQTPTSGETKNGSGAAAASEDAGPFAAAETVIFTDGACSGNPGPGGWAWAIEGGTWASGFDPATTNQRMEITAAYQAVLNNPGMLRIVSDSTYVVNCFRDRWWEGWQRRGWRNSKKEPVANRDLWEPFVDLVASRAVTFEWVKGHSGHRMNDLVDRLAVEAISRRGPASGNHPHAPAAPLGDRSGEDDSTSVRPRDRRAPSGYLWSVVGLRSEELAGSDSGRRLFDQLIQVIAAQQQLHGDVVVLSGGRPGAEAIGARAAAKAGVPYAIVLPYPDPIPRSNVAEFERFEQLCLGAESVITLESKRPSDGRGRTAALARRDGWLRAVSSGAAVVTAERRRDWDRTFERSASAAEDQLKRFSKALGDEVWELQVDLW